MEAVLALVLVVLAAIGGYTFNSKKKAKEQAKQKVSDAAAMDKEGEINATIAFADQVEKAKAAIDADIDSRPVTGDAAVDLADSITRARRRRRQRGSG